MTVDEAIKHCLSIAEKGKQCAGTELYECGEDFQQLAEWLTDYKKILKKVEHLTKWNHKLIDYKNEIVCKWGESQEELQEAKRLLKAAIEDMGKKNFCAKVCMIDSFACQVSDTCNFKWRYADEAEKLLGGMKK